VPDDGSCERKRVALCHAILKCCVGWDIFVWFDLVIFYLSAVFLPQGFKFLNFTFTVSNYLITSSAAEYLGMPQHLHGNFNFQVSTKSFFLHFSLGLRAHNVVNRWKLWNVFVKVWKNIPCSSLHSTTQNSTIVSWLWTVMRQKRRTSFVREINTRTRIYIYIYIYMCVCVCANAYTWKNILSTAGLRRGRSTSSYIQNVDIFYSFLPVSSSLSSSSFPLFSFLLPRPLWSSTSSVLLRLCLNHILNLFAVFSTVALSISH
jgi:hypothetical protein